MRIELKKLMACGLMIGVTALGLTWAAGVARAVESPSSSGEVATLDTPVLRVPLARKPPTIDGTMNEGEWDDASALSGFWYDYGQADFRYLAPPQTQLQVYTCYDKDNLYLAYVSPIHPEKSWLRARGRFPDTVFHPLYGMIWDDHLELEIRPFHDNVKGFQMGLLKWFINPIGTITDQHWSLKNQPGYQWQSGGTVRCGVTDKTWVTEIALPFKSLRPGDYAGVDADGQPLVKTPPPDGAAFRAWFTRAIGGNGEFFNVFDKHIWNTTKLKLVFDSQAPACQLNELGPVMEDNIDVRFTFKNHNTRSQTIRLGFFVESAGGSIYSSYNAPELKDGLLELLPGETKKIRLRHSMPGISREGNVLWFDVRTPGDAGNPAKVLFRTRLIDFHSMEGGATDGLSFKARRIDVIERLRPPRKDFDFRWDFSSYRKRLAVVVDTGIHGASEDAKRAKELKLIVTSADKEERTIAETKAPFTGDFACVTLDLPGAVGGEKYKLSALLFDENKRIVGEASPDPFTCIAEPWMNNKLGLDDVVWEPFVEIKPSAAGFETLKHRFTIDPSGLPAQIEIKPDSRELPLEARAPDAKPTAADLLAIGRGPQLRAPLRLEAMVNGQRVAAQVTQPAKAVRTWKSEIEYESKLKVGPVEVTLKTQYDCDGAMHAAMEYGAGAAAVIDRLELVGDFAGQIDLLAATMHGGGMQGADSWECSLPYDTGVVWDSGKVDRAELFYSMFVPFIWFGSGDRGFTFYCDSDQAWMLDKTGSTMTLERDKAGQITWRTLFVNHKRDVAGKRMINFTILTHPAKSKPKEFRKTAWLQRGDTWAANYRRENINLEESYLKARLREATSASKDVPDAQLPTYRKDAPPWNRYGRLRNEGVWPTMDRNWEDKAVYYLEQQIRIGRRVGFWWDEYWPVYRTDNLAEGDAYLRDPKAVEKNELPWQSGHVTGYMRNTFKRTARLWQANNIPQRNYVWANNSATLLESFAWDTQLVEECGAMHRSYELDGVTTYPNSLIRYMAHNFTGLVCRIVPDANLLSAGDDPRLERQLFGRALLNDFGVSPNGPHGRVMFNDHAARLINALQEFGYFEDQSTEFIPYWRIGAAARYGQAAIAGDRFVTGDNDSSKIYVSAFRRPIEIAGRKGYKTMFFIMNEGNANAREQFYLLRPERFFGGANAQTAEAIVKPHAVNNAEGDNDWRPGNLTAPVFDRNLTSALMDLETRGMVAQAPAKEKGQQVYGPVFIQARDYRILYAYGFPAK